MGKSSYAKQECVIEAVRHGLEGDAALDFIHRSGYAMTPGGIARHLRNMGGRRRIQELIAQGLTNAEILQACFPEDNLSDVVETPPTQGELFGEEAQEAHAHLLQPEGGAVYETEKMILKLPAYVHEAVRLAARAEGVTQNQLIIDILIRALSQMPHKPVNDADDEDRSATF